MNEFLASIDMYFHPLMDVNKEFIEEEKILKREQIKLLTYNIFLRPPPVKNNESDWKEARLADFIQELKNFDIVCLQEMFSSFNNRKQQLIKFANKSGLFFYCNAPSPSFFSKFMVDGGLLILSRFPIVDTLFRPFKYSVLSDSLSNKGILYAKIDVQGASLLVFNTHLQASYFGSSESHWDISSQTRIDHIRELVDFVKEILEQEQKKQNDLSLYKVLMMGDFNVDAYNYARKKAMNKNLSMLDTLNEYEMLVDYINELGEVRDLLKTKYKYHPYTYGYNGENLPMFDRVLTAKEDIGCCQCLDYIFEVDIHENKQKQQEHILHIKNFGGKSKALKEQLIQETDAEGLKGPPNRNYLSIDLASAKVENFLVENKVYQQLSDHFGLSVCFDLKHRNEV